MARKPRIEYKGAFYHVIARGNQRQNTFRDDSDYGRYLEILSAYKQQHGFLLYAFVLMKNHLHLLIQTQIIVNPITLSAITYCPVYHEKEEREKKSIRIEAVKKTNGKPYKDVKRSFTVACRKAGIGDVHFHDLRHTFASQLVMAGVDLTTVKELLGHRDIKMTLRCAHLAPSHKVKAVEIPDKT